jgi:hypothetical protein
MDQEERPSAAEAQLAEMLTIMIDDFETKNYPLPPVWKWKRKVAHGALTCSFERVSCPQKSNLIVVSSLKASHRSLLLRRPNPLIDAREPRSLRQSLPLARALRLSRFKD